MHWSEPTREGRTPAFCSACGSRTESRKRLSGTSSSLRHQVDLLAEIARRQDEDLRKIIFERDHLRMEADRRRTLGHAGAAHPMDEGLTQTKEQLEAEMASERAEINRIHRELQVWREQGLGEVPDMHGRPSSAEQDLRKEEVRHDAERQQWLTRRSVLEEMIEEVKARTQALERAPVAHTHRDRAGIDASRADANRLRVEVEEQQAAAAAAWSQTARLRQELEDERRSEKAGMIAHQRELNNIAEELLIAERRAEVEVDMRRSQEAQLQSVRSTIEALRTQLQRARSENAELRANLEQNQDVLRRLRG